MDDEEEKEGSCIDTEKHEVMMEKKMKSMIATPGEEIMRMARMRIAKAKAKPNVHEGDCQHTFCTIEKQCHVSLQTAPPQLLHPQYVLSLL